MSAINVIYICNVSAWLLNYVYTPWWCHWQVSFRVLWNKKRPAADVLIHPTRIEVEIATPAELSSCRAPVVLTDFLHLQPTNIYYTYILSGIRRLVRSLAESFSLHRAPYGCGFEQKQKWQKQQLFVANKKRMCDSEVRLCLHDNVVFCIQAVFQTISHADSKVSRNAVVHMPGQ